MMNQFVPRVARRPLIVAILASLALGRFVFAAAPVAAPAAAPPSVPPVVPTPVKPTAPPISVLIIALDEIGNVIGADGPAPDEVGAAPVEPAAPKPEEPQAAPGAPAAPAAPIVPAAPAGAPTAIVPARSTTPPA